MPRVTYMKQLRFRDSLYSFFFVAVSSMIILSTPAHAMSGIGYIETNDPPIYQPYECPPTHQWNADSQSCEIWWNSIYVVMVILSIITAAVVTASIIMYCYLRIAKKDKGG